jgi:hypothetical protein
MSRTDPLLIDAARSYSAWSLTLSGPMLLTIQGGTTEILRGIIARGLGLR